MDIWTIYYRPDCPFSRNTLMLLNKVLPHPEKQLRLIDVKGQQLNLIDILEKRGIFHHRTVPAIFRNEQFIGGDYQLRMELNQFGAA